MAHRTQNDTEGPGGAEFPAWARTASLASPASPNWVRSVPALMTSIVSGRRGAPHELGTRPVSAMTLANPAPRDNVNIEEAR